MLAPISDKITLEQPEECLASKCEGGDGIEGRQELVFDQQKSFGGKLQQRRD
jgi:hypothetical protein